MDFRNKLFSCSEEGGLVAGLIRCDDVALPRWKAGARTITWVNPGGRQRAYEVARVVADNAERFAFVDSRGREFELRELTPAFYNEHVKRPEDPALTGSAELLAAFESSLG